jgi:hypothetical protein
MMVFENPVNGYRETVDGGAVAWGLVFGPLYMMFRGLWGMAFLWLFGAAAASVGLLLLAGWMSSLLMAVGLDGVGFVLLLAALLLPHVLFAAAAPRLLRQKYLRMGWREVQPGSVAGS